MREFPHKSIFTSIAVKSLVSEEKDKCLALASLVDIGKFIPNIDTAKNIDLLPVAFNACVINRVNKNTDVVDTETAIAMYKEFVNKPINIEHNRQKVIGVILTAGFSAFGSDLPLTEEEVKVMKGPFNVTLGGIIWRVVCPELASFIEESNDPTSEHYQQVSASWELGFTAYRIALMEGGKRNLSDAKRIISDAKEVEANEGKLIALGGNGKCDDYFAYRMPSYDVLPLGIGFTEKPAAEVKGISVPVPVAKTEKLESVEAQEVTTANNISQNENKISQSIETDVKLGRKVNMKIASLTDITEDNLKQANASAAVVEFIASELKKGNDTYLAEKGKLTTELSNAQEASKTATAETLKVQTELEAVKKTVEALSAEKVEREKVEKFNARMSEVTAAYELDADATAAIVGDVRAIASDEDFGKFMAKAKVLLKGFAKKAAPFAKKNDDDADDKDAAKKKQEAKAAEDAEALKLAGEQAEAKKAQEALAAQAILDSAIDNADKSKGGLPNGSGAASPSLKEKYKNAFARENITITK